MTAEPPPPPDPLPDPRLPTGLNTGLNIGPIRRTLWQLAGLALVGLGFIGIALPLMPTVIFWILAAGAFARSSPRLEAWMLDHPRIGPPVRDWRERRAIPRRGKLMAMLGISLGFALFLAAARPDWSLAAAVATLLIAIAAYILSRPE